MRRKLKVGACFTRKLISPAQAEKALGKGHAILAHYAIKPPGKPVLAPESDPRPALAVDPGADFAGIACVDVEANAVTRDAAAPQVATRDAAA